MCIIPHSTVACQKGSTAIHPTCPVRCTPVTLLLMNMIDAQYSKQGAAAAWKFPWDTSALAHECGTLGMCILYIPSVAELHNCIPV